MQVNGVGNGAGHHHSMHQVTECNHEISAPKKGNTGAASASRNTLQSNVNQSMQEQGGFSLASWWKKLLAGGQKLFISIWGESPASKAVESSKDEGLQDEDQVMASLGDPETGQSDLGTPMNSAGAEAIAATGLRQQDLHNNPYFSAIEDTGKEKQTMWEKVRVRFQSVAGQLTGRFSNKNSFQTKQQKPKEDLRKHSRYRQDDLEIDCILTDDSYLLDSYDSKGAYSKLSPKK